MLSKKGANVKLTHLSFLIRTHQWAESDRSLYMSTSVWTRTKYIPLKLAHFLRKLRCTQASSATVSCNCVSQHAHLIFKQPTQTVLLPLCSDSSPSFFTSGSTLWWHASCSSTSFFFFTTIGSLLLFHSGLSWRVLSYLKMPSFAPPPNPPDLTWSQVIMTSDSRVLDPHKTWVMSYFCITF